MKEKVFINTVIYCFLRILHKLKLLSFLNLKIKGRLYKSKFLIPLHGYIGYINIFDKEPWMQRVIKEVMYNNSIFIDIGVNLGQTLIKVKAINPQVTYFGFEPNPVCFRYLYHLIEINKYSSIKIFPTGISQTEKWIDLVIPQQDDQWSSGASYIKFKEGLKIPSFLTPLVKTVQFDHQKKLIIKIDVEGSELDVLKSIEYLIPEFEPFIIIEILPAYSNNNKERINNIVSIEKFIAKHEYRIFLIDKMGELEEKGEIGIRTRIEDSNFLLSKHSI